MDHNQHANSIYQQRPLLQPIDCTFCTVAMRRRNSHALDVATVTSERTRVTDQGLDQALEAVLQILRRREHITILYDLRSCLLPSMTQVRHGMAWVQEEEQHTLLDQYLQGIVIVLSNRFVASLLNFIVRVLSPPQPLRVFRTEAAAYDFLRRHCKEPRDWTGLRGDFRKKRRRASSTDTVGSYAPTSVGACREVSQAPGDDQADVGMGSRFASCVPLSVPCFNV